MPRNSLRGCGPAAIQSRASAGKRNEAGQHTHDRVRLPVEQDRLPEEVEPAAPALAPQRLGQKHRARRAGAVVLGSERTARQRRDAQQREQLARRGGGLDAHGVGSGRGERQVEAAIGGEGLEGLRGAPLEVQEVGIRGPMAVEARARLHAPHREKPVGLREPEGAQERVVDHAEEGRVGADAEGQRGHGQEGPARLGPERAHRAPEVVPERHPATPAGCGSIGFSALSSTTRPSNRCTARSA